MKQKIILLTIFTYIALIGFVFSKDTSPVTDLWYSYDGAMVGARAVSMGGAYAAVSNDADATYFNPAGLYYILKNKLMLVYRIDRIHNTDLENVTKYQSLNNKKLLFFSICGPMGGMSIRPIAKYEKTNNEGDIIALRINKYTISFAANSEVNENFIIGMNINYFTGFLGFADISQNNINLTSGQGVGVDWGFMYETSDMLRFGVMLENAPAALYWDEYIRDIIPFHLRCGLALTLTDDMTYAIDYDRNYYKGREDLVLYHVGVEQLVLEKKLAFRFGVSGEKLDKASDITFGYGVGYKKNNSSLDLGIQTYKVEINNNKEIVSDVVMSIGLSF